CVVRSYIVSGVIRSKPDAAYRGASSGLICLPIVLSELKLPVPLRAGDFMPRNSSSILKATRAAMYVRMSTEHQQYSTKNQADAIEKYAAEHNLTIVKQFIDSGKSGLTL